jgi:hypothetical protein
MGRKPSFNGMCIKAIFTTLAQATNGSKIIVEDDEGLFSGDTVELRVTIQREFKDAFVNIAQQSGHTPPEVVRILIIKGIQKASTEGLVVEER